MTTSRILYTFWKIIGLCPFNLSKDGIIRFSYSGAFYSIILSLFCFVCYTGLMESRISLVDDDETLMSLIADMIAKTSQMLVLVITWLYFGLRQNTLRKIQQMFRKIVKFCEKLEIRESYSKSVKSAKVQTLLINFSMVAVYSSIAPCRFVVRLPFNFIRIVYPNFTIQFIATMSVIRDQFSSVNDKIREVSKGQTTRITVCETLRQQRRNSREIDSYSESDNLRAYVCIHSQLVDLTVSIVNFWSPSLYLIIMIHLFELVSSFYDIFLFMKDKKLYVTRDYVFFMAQIYWFLYHSLALLVMVTVSDSISYQANQIGNILHEIQISNSSDTCLESTKTLSLRLLQSHLDIELFGALPLKLSLVHKISSIATTYITVMLQLDALMQKL